MVMKQLNSLNSFVIVISLISHNFVPFYWIQVGFSLKSIVLITEHFYTLCEIDFQILNFGAKFERHLWRHIVNHKCDATTTECGFPQTMFLPSFASFGILYIPLWTKWKKNTHFWPSRIWRDSNSLIARSRQWANVEEVFFLGGGGFSSSWNYC